jgi:cysteine desulfurase
MKRIYLDYAALTPISFGVLFRSFVATLTVYGNPGSIHKEGVVAKKMIESAKKDIAKIIHTQKEHIVFTSGGTEGCNLVIFGVLHKAILNGIEKPNIIISAIEHPAVYDVCINLSKENKITLTILPVDENGVVKEKDLRESINENTILVCVHYINNEIGTIEPIKDLARVVKKYRKEKESKYPLFFTDSAQAPNLFPIHIDSLGVDFVTLNGSKIYGPRSSGILFVKDREMIDGIILGGSQEYGLRAGTEDVGKIVSFTQALLISEKNKDFEYERLSKLQNFAREILQQKIPEVCVTVEQKYSSPHILHITVPGFDSETVILYLDQKGFAVSSKSACKTDDKEVSHVLKALNLEENKLLSSIRISFGRKTKIRDIEKFVNALRQTLDILKK